jgi:hypothetical protein
LTILSDRDRKVSDGPLCFVHCKPWLAITFTDENLHINSSMAEILFLIP